MKSIIKIGALMLCLAVFVISCKEHKHSEETHTHDSPALDKADMAMNDVYQCPMDCEKGKTYNEAGTCGHCGMELKKVEKDSKEVDSDDAKKEGNHDHEHGEDDGHNH